LFPLFSSCMLVVLSRRVPIFFLGPQLAQTTRHSWRVPPVLVVNRRVFLFFFAWTGTTVNDPIPPPPLFFGLLVPADFQAQFSPPLFHSGFKSPLSLLLTTFWSISLQIISDSINPPQMVGIGPFFFQKWVSPNFPQVTIRVLPI